MRDYYKILENPLGIGAYGEVRRCYWKKDITNKCDRFKEYRAVKVMSKSYMEEKNIKDFQNEVDINLSLQHPNITKVHEWFEDPKRYMLVVELINGGELFEHIQEKTDNKFDNREAGIVLKQLLSAVAYMHDERTDQHGNKWRCVHRDLKPENILINESGDGIPEVKLIDFGTAKKFRTEKADHPNGGTYDRAVGLQEKVGTLAYMAPEILWLKKRGAAMKEAQARAAFDQYFYTEKCDVWSIGVIAYVLLCGR